MKDYKLNGSVYEITLENDKKVKVASKWVETSIKNLGTDIEDVLLMWLEDNDYLVNEEQEELNKQAKGVVKLVANDKSKKKTPKERVVKPQPEKEFIINLIATELTDVEDLTDLIVENKAKLITFKYKNQEYKLDLVQKRKKKEEK